ncbi:MAG: hypothetical protein ABIP02_07280 [Arenimonas sp.]
MKFSVARGFADELHGLPESEGYCVGTCLSLSFLRLPFGLYFFENFAVHFLHR